jgi:membrane-associated phospholipid phosphatase
MRIEWTKGEYQVGRWASPVLSFGCASLVGLSRIHADKHYFTDVLAGAVLGTALAELYYWLAYDAPDAHASAGPSHLYLSMRFSL